MLRYKMTLHAEEVYSGLHSAVMLEIGSGISVKQVIIPEVTDFSISDTTSVISWNPFGTIFAKKMSSGKDWSGSFNGKVNFSDENRAQLAILKKGLRGERARIYFYFSLVTNADGEPDLEKSTVAFGDIFLTSNDMDADATDIANLAISFEGSGALTYIVNGEMVDRSVDDPIFSPAPGSFSNSVDVTLVTATDGAAIRYTIDGTTTPTETTGTLYIGPITINTTTTVRAIAYKAGFPSSGVVSGTYVITI